MTMPTEPRSAVEEYASRAGELTYRLRRESEELISFLERVKDIYMTLEETKSGLMGEGVRFDPELPAFLLESLSRLEQFNTDRSMAKLDVAMPGANPPAPGKF